MIILFAKVTAHLCYYPSSYIKPLFSFVTVLRSTFVKTFALVSVVFVIFFNLSTQKCQATVQEAEFLQNVAKQYMLAQFANNKDDIKYEVKVSRVDPNRDYGGKCSGFLTAQLTSNQIKKSNVVKIICSRKENPYTVSIPVNVIVQRPTAVATENIPKGTILTSNLLSKQYVNEGLNTSSAVTNLNSILGAKVRKDIRAGDVIKQSDLCLIAKGDIVTIEAVSSNMQIKTQGVALEEGKLNDLISVRNSKSKKVIQGIVVSPNTVRVTF